MWDDHPDTENEALIRALNELVKVRGAPLPIRLENAPEFIAHALAQWA